jgi:hypothetical protein
MSRLYYTENGRVIPTSCEELADYRIARKVLHLPATDQPATLYVLARAYPEHKQPLRIAVNDVPISGPSPGPEDGYLWYEIAVPPSLLQVGPNRFEFWADTPAMQGWSLGLEGGHCQPQSWLSTDGGSTWRREKMGHLHTMSGEYVVRVRLAEGEDPSPPPMVWETPSTGRLERVRRMIPAVAREGTSTLDRVRALTSWVCTRWVYRCEGASYSPWDAETIIAWGQAGRGHDGRDPIVMCVHYGVTLVTCCAAIGIPARPAIFTGGVNQHNGHFTAEVWLQEYDKWVMVDPTLDAIVFQNGTPLSVGEIQQAGDDLSGLIAWGPGYAFQMENPFIPEWIERVFVPNICFRHRSIWPRADFLSRPELGPAWHGSTAYCETDLVWETGDLAQGFGMFSHFGDKDYFDRPPADFPG